jgi:hypothetical protein
VTVPIYLNGDSHRLFACVAILESLAAKTAAHGFIVVGKLRFSRMNQYWQGGFAGGLHTNGLGN